MNQKQKQWYKPQSKESNAHSELFFFFLVEYEFSISITKGGKDASAQVQRTKYLVLDLRQKALFTFWQKMLTIETYCHNSTGVYSNRC